MPSNIVDKVTVIYATMQQTRSAAPCSQPQQPQGHCIEHRLVQLYDHRARRQRSRRVWTGDERWRTRCPPHPVQDRRRREIKSTAVPLQGTVSRSRHHTRIALCMVGTSSPHTRVHGLQAHRVQVMRVGLDHRIARVRSVRGVCRDDTVPDDG